MDTDISPETTERIRALCRRISVAHDLDDEIQRELFSHMEDKLHGYLSGGEKVTEEDALILVREHFGKPEVVRGLFREVHAPETHLSLLRTTGAFITAFLGSIIVSLTAVTMVFVFFRIVITGDTGMDYARIILGIPAQGLIFVLFCLVLWSILLKWKKEMNRGAQPWFIRVRGYNLLGILILLSFGVIFVNALSRWMIEATGLSGFGHPDATALILREMQNRIAERFSIPVFLSIIWWFDRQPMKPYSFLEGVWLSLILIVGSAAIRTSPEGYTRNFIERLWGMDLLNLGIAVGLYLWYVAFKRGRIRSEMKPFLTR